MQNARVLLIENDDISARATKRILEQHGHVVVLEVATLRDLIALFPSGKLFEYRVSLAIVDGTFPEQDPYQKAKFNGPKAIELIRERFPEIKTIGFSSYPKDKYSFGDAYVCKIEPMEVLLKVIESL